jgi:hypothetical protein
MDVGPSVQNRQRLLLAVFFMLFRHPGTKTSVTKTERIRGVMARYSGLSGPVSRSFKWLVAP